MTLPIVLLLASVTLSILCIGAYFMILRPSNSQLSEHKQQLGKLTHDFFILSKSVGVLRELSAQYFVTMNENGFVELCNIETALAGAIEKSESLLAQGDTEKFEQLIRYLYIQRGFGTPPSFLWGSIGDQVSFLEEWGKKANSLIMNLTECVSKSSNELKEVGGAARRKRKHTTLMLNEARQAMESLSH